MAGRRQFGSVRKLPSGRWQARYYALDGRRVLAPQTFPTKSDATLWLDSVRTEQAMGLRVDPGRAKILLGQYATEWLSDRVGISPRTREIYAAQLKLHILPLIDPSVPALGDLPLVALTPELLRKWYAALAERRSPSVAAKAYVRLRQILARAVDDDRIAKNPCRIERGGVEHHAEQRFATMEELATLAGAVPDRYRAMVLTAGLAGLRLGELLALRRSELDLDDGVVHVIRKRLRLASGETIEDAPKTHAGIRTVALPGPLVDELRVHLERFVGAAPDAYVFTSAEGTPIERNNFRNRIWLPTCASVGMEGFRFHDLRHTAGTLAARTGATTKELMARLGHASANAAMIYQHASDDRDRRIADVQGAMAREVGLGRGGDGTELHQC
jgi:integrase